MNENKSINRRGFFRIATLAIGGIITAVMGIPSIAYIIGPALQRNKTES